MVTLEEYNKNVDEILKHRKINRNYFDLYFKAYKGENNNIDISYLSDLIIKETFSFPLCDNKPLIPYEFFNTPVGKVFLHLKYNCNDSYKYLVKDVAYFANVSNQQIIKDANNGNLIGEKVGRDWTFTQENVDNYLIKKGLEPLSRKKILKYIEKEEKFFTNSNSYNNESNQFFKE